MITRIWRGWTSPSNADAFESLLRGSILPGIAGRGIEGYRGAHLLRRSDADEIEFVTILWFDSIDELFNQFAGWYIDNFVLNGFGGTAGSGTSSGGSAVGRENDNGDGNPFETICSFAAPQANGGPAIVLLFLLILGFSRLQMTRNR